MIPAPTDNRSGPAFVYRAVIPREGKAQILLVPGENGWTLPHWELSWIPSRQDVSHINRSVRETLGLDVRVLRCLGWEADPQQAPAPALYLLENRSPGG